MARAIKKLKEILYKKFKIQVTSVKLKNGRRYQAEVACNYKKGDILLSLKSERSYKRALLKAKKRITQYKWRKANQSDERMIFIRRGWKGEWVYKIILVSGHAEIGSWVAFRSVAVKEAQKALKNL